MGVITFKVNAQEGARLERVEDKLRMLNRAASRSEAIKECIRLGEIMLNTLFFEQGNTTPPISLNREGKKVFVERIHSDEINLDGSIKSKH